MSIIGGATVKDFVSRTMNKLLHPDLANQFVWAGRLTKKYAFKQLELASALSGQHKLILLYEFASQIVNYVLFFYSYYVICTLLFQ